MAPSSNEISCNSTTTGGNNVSLKTRIILLGDHGVGKTAFLAQIIQEEGRDSVPVRKTRNPFRSSGCVKKVKLGDKNIDVILQDTAGQERYRSLTSSYYRSANGCLLFYNANIPSSFDNLSSWLDDVYRYCPDNDPPVILVGITNKHYHNNTDMARNGNKVNRNPSYRNSSNYNNNNNNYNNSYKSDGPSSKLRQLRDSFRSKKFLPLRETVLWSRRKYSSSTDVRSSRRTFSSLNYDVNVSRNDVGRGRDSPATVHSGLLPKTTSLPCLNYDTTVHRTMDSYYAYKQKHRRCHGNVAGNVYNNDLIEDEERDDSVDDDDDNEKRAGYEYEEPRAISEEQAQNFAYSRGISYREVEIGGDYAAIEDVLQRMAEATFAGRRRSSLWDNGPDIVIIKPSVEKESICCSRRWSCC